MEEKYFGHSVIRKEGREKVTGRARYVDDLAFPDMLYGVTVRSSVARGRILGIRYGEGIPWGEFTIVTAADIPGLAAKAAQTSSMKSNPIVLTFEELQEIALRAL